MLKNFKFENLMFFTSGGAFRLNSSYRNRSDLYRSFWILSI